MNDVIELARECQQIADVINKELEELKKDLQKIHKEIENLKD